MRAFGDSRGITITEILLAFLILGILLAFSLPAGVRLLWQADFDTAVDDLLQTFRRAQALAQLGESDSAYGIYFSAGQYTLFKGSSYAGRDTSFDQIFDIPPGVTMNPTFGGGDVVFSKLGGRPDETGSVTLTSEERSETIEINRLGRIARLPPPLEHYAARRETEETKTSGGWSPVSGGVLPGTAASPNGWLAASNFTPGERYLLLIWGEHNTSNINKRSGIRVTHGGVPFAESETTEETDRNSPLYKTPYFWFTVWTAVPGENIDIEYFFDSPGGGDTARVEDVTLLAVNAEALIESGNLIYDSKVASNKTLTTTFSPKTSLIWTPESNGDAWWVMGYTRADIFDINGPRYQARITIDGVPRVSQLIQGEDTLDTPIYGLGWVTSFTNALHTISLELSESGADMQWEAAGVFALRLPNFRNFAFEANPGLGPTMSSVNLWVEQANINPNVSVIADWLITSGSIVDDNGNRVLGRIQSSETSITDDTGGRVLVSTDEIPNTLADLQYTLSAGVHDFDYDTETTLAGNSNTRDAWIVGFPMWLGPEN